VLRPTGAGRALRPLRRPVLFHGLRHPAALGGPEIERFRTDLAANGHVAASTPNQAFDALLFLSQQVLGIELPRLDALRALRPKRLPAVLFPDKVRGLLDVVEGGAGLYRLMAGLLYGAGLRRRECCQLRAHDLDLARQQRTVRHGHCRVGMRPRSLRPDSARTTRPMSASRPSSRLRMACSSSSSKRTRELAGGRPGPPSRPAPAGSSKARRRGAGPVAGGTHAQRGAGRG
jgi:integrase